MKFDTDVLIVGAGPVGLVAAARLAAVDVDCLVIEADTTPPHDLRASTFHPPTLEMLDELGLAEPLFAAGLISPTWQIRLHETGERALFDLAAIAADTPYPFRLQCEQQILCAVVTSALEGRVDIRRGSAVTAVAQSDRNVTVDLADGVRLTARYVIGADGARSTVRRALGFEFDGETYPETTLLVTTSFAFDTHLPGLSNVNYCWSDHGTFSLLRLPEMWRCSLYADDGETVEEALSASSVERKLQRIVTRDVPYDVCEVRPYRVHQRIVTDYRRGRVLLAGDAAHLNSPAGGMGMNGGIHDVVNLTGKLAAVLAGADDALLDRYTRQRQPIAKDQILAQAHRNRTRMRERDPDKRRAELARLQAITADPAAARTYLLRSSMIEGLRQSEAIE